MIISRINKLFKIRNQLILINNIKYNKCNNVSISNNNNYNNTKINITTNIQIRQQNHHHYYTTNSTIKSEYTFTSVGNNQLDLIIKTIENQPKDGPLSLYNEMVNSGKIKSDPYQISTVKLLQNLYNQLKHKDFFINQQFVGNQKNVGLSFNAFKSFFSDSGKSSNSNSMLVEDLNLIKGIYLYGDVGCGKSFLMDLFYNSIDIEKKKRIHFHHFMLDVHKRIHKWRQTKGPDEDDPIPPLSRELVKESWLLCFDEFQVTDVSDAMILKRLFSQMFEMGAILVTTSNRAPTELYKNGLNRQLFIPFIHFLESKCLVQNLNSGIDYRLSGTRSGGNRVYFKSDSKEDVDEFYKLFNRLSKGEPMQSKQLILSTGRKVNCPKTVADQIALFKFTELCDQALGADDYIEISKQFHTLFVEDIPKMNESSKNQARRFITLVDVLYEHKVKFICTAAASPGQLFMSEGVDNDSREVRQLADDLTLTPEQLSRFNGEEERFMFARAVSRLIEMQSDQYLMKS